MSVRVLSTEFVQASDLFENCRSAWHIFAYSDPNCSWGDNNRTLINASYIGSILRQYEVEEDDPADLPQQIYTVLRRIKETGEQLINRTNDDFYVDLEN